MASSSLRLQRRHSRLTFIHLAGLSCKVSHTGLGRSAAPSSESVTQYWAKCWDAGARAHARGRPVQLQPHEADGTSPPRQRSCCNHREDKRPARPAPFALRCCERRNAFDLGRVPWAKKKNGSSAICSRLAGSRSATIRRPGDPAGPRMHPRCFISTADSAAPEQDRCPKSIRQQTIPIVTRIAFSIKQPASVNWSVRE
jgi:hypothetical protein